MRVLVTGATGFLGRYVVAAATRHGYRVSALVRPSRKLPDDFFPDGVAIVRGDLRNAASLPVALRDIDAVIHLAACVVGDDDSQFASTVVGTENLLAEMAQQQVTHLIHCSTFSVYDWQQADKVLDEQSTLERNLYARDGYAVSKTWQERIVRRAAAKLDWQLTILRPGFIWGAGNELIAGIGQSIGKWHIVIGGRRPLPLTYVENCADCFVTALGQPAAIGETFNVVDTEAISAWRYMGRCVEAGIVPGRRIYLPYWVGLASAQLASTVSRMLFGRAGKLPGLLVPIKFRARFRPLDFPNRKLRESLQGEPKWSFHSAWRRLQSGAAAASLTANAASPLPQAKPEKTLV